MTFQDPVFEPLLVVAQREIPVLGGTLHEAVARVVLVGGVDKLLGRKRGSALLALVAVGTLGTTARTGAHDIAVGEELAGHLVTVLLLGYLFELAVVIELAEEVGCKLVVYLAGGAAVDVKRDAELFKRVLDELVIAVYHLLHADALLAGTYGHGYAVLIASADEYHILFLQSEISYIDVGRHIYAGEMADMHTAVGVRKRRSHGSTLEILLHICCDCIYFGAKLQNYY